MTRAEQIDKAALDYCGYDTETIYAHIENAFIAGAEWADSHPDSKARNKVLDEACEWLRSQQFQEYFIERFLKAMTYERTEIKSNDRD